MSKIKGRPIHLKPTKVRHGADIAIAGWYQGKNTYLWIGLRSRSEWIAVVSGRRLYNFCKAVVRHYESEAGGER